MGFIGIALLFHVVDNKKTVFPTNGGEIFYIANHAENTLGMHTVPDFVHESTPVGVYQSFKRQALLENPLLENDQAVSRFWYGKTFQQIMHYPERFFLREINKALLLVGANDISQNFYLPYIKQVTLRQIPFIGFAFILALGVSGFCFFMPRDTRLLIVLAPVVVTVLTCMVFFVSARMRIPMVPFLIIAGAMWWRQDVLALQRLKAAFLALTVFVASYLVTVIFPDNETRQDRYNLAVTMSNAKMYKQANVLLEGLLQEEMLPKYVFLKAVILTAEDRCELAVPLYNQLVDNHSLREQAQFNLQLCINRLQVHR
jgi:hypothetical protein